MRIWCNKCSWKQFLNVELDNIHCWLIIWTLCLINLLAFNNKMTGLVNEGRIVVVAYIFTSARLLTVPFKRFSQRNCWNTDEITRQWGILTNSWTARLKGAVSSSTKSFWIPGTGGVHSGWYWSQYRLTSLLMIWRVGWEFCRWNRTGRSDWYSRCLCCHWERISEITELWSLTMGTIKSCI